MESEMKASLEHELTRKAYSHGLYISKRAYAEFSEDEQRTLRELGAESSTLGDMDIYDFRDDSALVEAGVKLPCIPTAY